MHRLGRGCNCPCSLGRKRPKANVGRFGQDPDCYNQLIHEIVTVWVLLRSACTQVRKPPMTAPIPLAERNPGQTLADLNRTCIVMISSFM